MCFDFSFFLGQKMKKLFLKIKNPSVNLNICDLFDDKIFLQVEKQNASSKEKAQTFKNLMLLESGLNKVGYSIANETAKLLNLLKPEQVIELSDFLSANTLQLESKKISGLFKNENASLAEKEILTCLKAYYDIFSAVSVNNPFTDKEFLSEFLNLEQIEETDLLQTDESQKTKTAMVNCKQLSFLDTEETEQYLKNLLCGNVALSSNKIDGLKQIFDCFDINSIESFLLSMQDSYQNKINKTFVLNYLFDAYLNKKLQSNYALHGILCKSNNITDYLRFLVGIPLFNNTNTDNSRTYNRNYVCDYIQAIALNKGRYSFNMTKPVKKEVMNLFLLFMFDEQWTENKFVLDDMFAYRDIWLSFFNYFSLGKNKKVTIHVQSLIQKLYKRDKKGSYGNKVEQSIQSKDMETALNELVKKPGVFAKRISSLLKMDAKKTLDVFENKVVKKVSNKVLLQLLTYAKNKEENAGYIIAKARLSPIYVNFDKIGKKKEIKSKHLNKLKEIIVNELYSRYSSLESLGNVYIDKSVSKLNMSFNQTKSNATKNLAFGSQVKIKHLLKENQHLKKIRAFIYWKDCSDLDLSFQFYNDKFTLLDTVSYFNLEGYGKHSGDVRTAPNGGAEFVDIDLESIKNKTNARYGLMFVNNFSGVPFTEMASCYAGLALVDDESEDAKQLQTRNILFKSDLKSNHEGCATYLYDFKKNKIIWLDTGMSSRFSDGVYSNNLYDILVNNIVSGNNQNIKNFKSSLERTIFLALKGQFVSFEDLIYMHSFARGKVVNNIDEADTIVCLDSNSDKIQNSLNQSSQEQDKKPPRIISALDFNKELIEFI